ncbi:helix-turn-helix transcriptional regulator [Sphingomonas dokdonensis]|uniref:Prophage CP4-57 regulatory protein (AlpA) n=1 Tax=Sphingomonas dokdonensis TaxID=344880 RepID=A0A245ZDP9_9SPHN|nr:AlpA family phage regulatory protein [Sphingomonas dokdonensis]OWK27895.1 prophage CP4-57 regulatory protein (AlpA) [Sphingomonas dokdonensis]
MNADRGRFLRANDVIRETGLSRTTIYRREREGNFPKRVRLSTNAMGWWSVDIDRWKEERLGVELH